MKSDDPELGEFGSTAALRRRHTAVGPPADVEQENQSFTQKAVGTEDAAIGFSAKEHVLKLKRHFQKSEIITGT